MTDTFIAAAHGATNDFPLGSVITHSGAVLSRHFLTFFIGAVIQTRRRRPEEGMRIQLIGSGR
jgi:hypothetical protein